MRPTAFVDTAGWLALFNSRDSLHNQAVAVQYTLRQQKTALITTDFVLIEVADTFAAPPLRAIAIAFIDGLRQSETTYAVEIVPVSETLLAAGWDLYKQRPDKEWGQTDCTGFAVMQDYGISEALTSDHHFAQAGFQCLLSPRI